MKRNKLRIIAVFFAVIMITAPFIHAYADSSEPVISSNNALLYNAKYDQMLYSKSIDEMIYPASFTKLMTAYLAFEYNKQNPGTLIQISDEMLSGVGGTTMRLKAGETFSFDSLLQGLVIIGANDAAQVIAITVSGSVENFVNAMNEKAKEFGMENTYYANPTGVDSSLMHTTLRDTLALCKELYRVNDFMIMSSLPRMDVAATELSKPRTYTNKNLLVFYSYVTDYYIKGTQGMTAGYTNGAGYCSASTLVGEDGLMIAIFSGGADTSEAQNGTQIQSYYDAKKLYEWADEEFNAVKLAGKDDIICEKKVILGSDQDHVILGIKNDLELLLPSEVSENIDKIKKNINTDSDTMTAPVVKGMVYGSVEYVYGKNVIGTAEITALSNVTRSPFLTAFSVVERFFSQGVPRAVLICICAAIVIYILVLIGMIAVQNARKNREKNVALAQLEEAENRRLAQVRANERVRRKRNWKIVKKTVYEGFKALNGNDDGTDYVAKVPEKYRRKPAPMPNQTKRNSASNIQRKRNSAYPPRNTQSTGRNYTDQMRKSQNPSNRRRNDPDNRRNK